jgi:hypothetical protein
VSLTNEELFKVQTSLEDKFVNSISLKSFLIHLFLNCYPIAEALLGWNRRQRIE